MTRLFKNATSLLRKIVASSIKILVCRIWIKKKGSINTWQVTMNLSSLPKMKPKWNSFWFSVSKRSLLLFFFFSFPFHSRIVCFRFYQLTIDLFYFTVEKFCCWFVETQVVKTSLLKEKNILNFWVFFFD